MIIKYYKYFKKKKRDFKNSDGCNSYDNLKIFLK